MGFRLKTMSILLVLVFATLPFAVAQTEPVAILEYYDNDLELVVTDADGFEYSIYIGMELSAGDTIKTGATSAELRLEPNGTVVKIAPETEFAVESIQGADGAESSDFRLASGKFRAVAAQVTGARYNFRSRTAVGGVRGTELGMVSIPGQTEALYVLEGAVEFINSATGEALNIVAGQFADVFADSFEAVAYSSEQLGSFLQGMSEFEGVTPPQPATEVSEATEEDTEETEDETDEDEDAVEEETEDTDDVVTVAPTTPPTPPETTGGPDGGEPADGPLSGMMSRVGEFLGMDAGSVTIGGETYAKVTLNPRFTVGKLGVGLYLPIVYTGNMFDPDDWYKPAGNSEWSFGTDQDWANEPLVALQDFFTDVTLKIRYITWGEQGVDDTYLKVGNLNDMTIGHGILMRDYANDVDFPAVRRVGLNVGFGTQTKPFGIEAVVNDIATPEIFGGRFVFRPGAPGFLAGLGVSGIVDSAPASVLPDTAEFSDVIEVDPVFINVAVDIDVPIISREILGITAFADVGGMLPYLRNAEPIEGVEAGLQTEALFDFEAGTVQNYGFMAGLLGNILMVDYRLEFRRFDGAFKPAFYSAPYDRIRGERAIETVAFLRNPDSEEFQGSVMGVYGEASASLFDLLQFTAGYMWPWAFDENGGLTYSDEDYLLAEVGVAEGLIPFGITGSLSYSRTHFAPTLLDKEGFEDARLFDANTVLSGEIVYPVSNILKIAASVTTTVLRDDEGNIVYETDADDVSRPKFGPSISVETRLGL